jgi:serine/threonine protein kinase
MAPEQVRGEPCDAQSDLFSLGCVMYALCTGHPPFRAETVYGVMQRVLHDEPRPIVEQNAAIPVWLERFVLRLLQKDKANRFGAAGEIVEELTAELAYLQNPTVAPKPARKWASLATVHRRTWRRRGALAAAIAGAALVVALIARQGTDGAPTQASDPPDSVSVEGAPSTAPLWLFDGTEQAQRDAQALHKKWHAAAEANVRDTWSEEVAKVRHAVAALAADQDWSAQ